MALLATRLYPKQSARFRVVVSTPRGPSTMQFRAVTGMTARLVLASQEHGGALTPYQYPVGVQFPPVTLEGGSTTDRMLWEWFGECVAVAANRGGLIRGHRRIITVYEHERQSAGAGGGAKPATGLGGWAMVNAVITEFSPGDYNNESGEFLIERAVIAYDYLQARQVKPDAMADLTHLSSRFP